MLLSVVSVDEAGFSGSVAGASAFSVSAGADGSAADCGAGVPQSSTGGSSLAAAGVAAAGVLSQLSVLDGVEDVPQESSADEVALSYDAGSEEEDS